jgi:hypothetical protein
MNVNKKVVTFSILLMLVITCCLSSLSKQSASASTSRSSGPQFSITLLRSSDRIGPVNISINDTVVATNIDSNEKSKLVVPITIPDTLMNGAVRICATGIASPAPQICTDVPSLKNNDKGLATLDMSKAMSG